MRTPTLAVLSLALFAGALRGDDGWFDRVDDRLTWHSADATLGARVSGTLDLETYRYDTPAPAFISAEKDTLFTPRLNVFLDANAGRHLYAFAQARADRGFDPKDAGLRGRLDEWALRVQGGSAVRVALQAGKFATVVGNWVRRHDSWNNPFITAPLAYENVTGIFDTFPAYTPQLLLEWANLGPGPFPAGEYLAQVRAPILWGPSYATGASLSLATGRVEFAAEIKNAGLSSRPEVWGPDNGDWEHPTMSARVGLRPNAAWNLGASVSSGPYLRPTAFATVPAGTAFGDFRETMYAADLSFARHHFQLWAECFYARFAIPPLGVAETFSYYVETRWKFTPQFFAALRWNQQVFADFPLAPGRGTPWGRDTWRVDFAPTYRFTPHAELKLQLSWQHHPMGRQARARLAAAQFVLRF